MFSQNSTPSESSLTQQGIDAYNAGNVAEAIKLLGDALRANRQDEQAWLYLGLALDDPQRKRQAFQNVLDINPNNEQAKTALAGLGAASSTPPPAGGTASKAASDAASKIGEQANATFNAASASLNEAWSGKRSYKVPYHVEGAPAEVTVPYLVENGRKRVNQAIDIYTKQNFELIVSAGQGATMWDAVLVAGTGIFLVAAASFIGHLVYWPLHLFQGGLGGLIWIILAPILLTAANVGGFYGGTLASKAYLDNQHVKVSMSQHTMYFAMIFLPLMVVNAVTTLITLVIPPLACLLFPVLLVAGLYGLWLLKAAFDRVYGTDENRGLITAAISIGGWVVGYIVVGIVAGIFATLLGAIFRAPFSL